MDPIVINDINDIAHVTSKNPTFVFNETIKFIPLILHIINKDINIIYSAHNTILSIKSIDNESYFVIDDNINKEFIEKILSSAWLLPVNLYIDCNNPSNILSCLDNSRNKINKIILNTYDTVNIMDLFIRIKKWSFSCLSVIIHNIDASLIIDKLEHIFDIDNHRVVIISIFVKENRSAYLGKYNVSRTCHYIISECGEYLIIRDAFLIE